MYQLSLIITDSLVSVGNHNDGDAADSIAAEGSAKPKKLNLLGAITKPFTKKIVQVYFVH